MKKTLCIVLVIVLCVSMAACGGNLFDKEIVFPEVTDEEQTTAEAEIVQTDSAEENGATKEAQYRIIRWDRSALNEDGKSSENYYYDYAELQGESPAYQKINAVLYSEAERVMGKETTGEEIKEWGFGSGYYYARTEVTHNQDGFFCVTILTDEYLGGNTSHGYFYNYCFDLNTGEIATLTDLTGMDAESLLPEIRRIAWEGLQEKHGDMLFEGVEEQINRMELADFQFGIDEGQIQLYFEKYSVTNGTAGETWIPTGLYVSGSPAKEEGDDLASKDSDNDGYNDAVDLNPDDPYKVPIILLHGRTSNTMRFFGVETKISDANNHYDADNSTNGFAYTSPASHKITDIQSGMLGDYLEKMGYQTNKNLFAFNYPNADMVKINATKLYDYIKNLIEWASVDFHSDVVDSTELFATKQDKKDGKVKFILIGHSMGGVVSRYYVENMTENYVESIITICTPHYGSGLAGSSDTVDFTETKFVPCDVDLERDSWLFGGEQQDIQRVALLRPEHKYAYTHQTDPLDGNQDINVKYYAIGGYDVERQIIDGDKISSELKNHFENGGAFSVAFDRNVDSKQKCKDSINNALEAASRDWFNGSSRLELSDADGDDVVDWMSQFAVRFDDTIDSQELAGSVLILSSGHNGMNDKDLFHNLIANEVLMHEAVVNFITEQTAPGFDADGWTMVDAHYDENQDYIVLTQDMKKWQCGSMWYNDPIEGDFVFEMDYYTGSADRRYGGADGIVVAFYADSEYKKPSGVDIGFSGCKGYGIELDTYYNSERSDPREYNHIGLVKESVGNHIVYGELPEAEDERWHHLKIEVKNGVCSAYVDGVLKLSNPVEETGYQRFGITAATGEGHNLHAVKNIVLAEV